MTPGVTAESLSTLITELSATDDMSSTNTSTTSIPNTLAFDTSSRSSPQESMVFHIASSNDHDICNHVLDVANSLNAHSDFNFNTIVSTSSQFTSSNSWVSHDGISADTRNLSVTLDVEVSTGSTLPVTTLRKCFSYISIIFKRYHTGRYFE